MSTPLLTPIKTSLKAFNTFGMAATAKQLLTITSEQDIFTLLVDKGLRDNDFFVLGAGSNLVLTGDVQALVLKVEIFGREVVGETDNHWIVQAGAGENWHDFVAWTLAQNMPGLENLALIPGTVGAAPVQNIGAYGVELQDRFDSLRAINLQTGEAFNLDAQACSFNYRDSIFKHNTAIGLKNKALITQVRFALPKKWQRDIGYADLEKKSLSMGVAKPSARQIFDWVCSIRQQKLPDPKRIGNVGSFFKNPLVTPQHCQDILAHEPSVTYYKMPDGNIKLAAGWLIDACGWRGKAIGNAAVHERHALILVNQEHKTGECATGGEVMTLAGAIQTSVYERFGIRLEIEPVVV